MEDYIIVSDDDITSYWAKAITEAKLPPISKLILLSIRFDVNRRNGYVKISNAEIAKYSGTSKSTVGKHIKNILNSGLLIRYKYGYLATIDFRPIGSIDYVYQEIVDYTNLYILSNGMHFKVGISKDVNRRIKELQTGSSTPISCVYKKVVNLDFAYGVESDVKRDIINYNTIGEWFNCDYSIIKNSLEKSLEKCNMSCESIIQECYNG